MKISECVRVQHWYHVFRLNKISVSLCLCLLLHRRLLLRLCCRHHRWLAHSSFINCWDRTAPQWLSLMFYIFSWPDICMISAPNYLYVLDMMVCYLPSLQNLVSFNLDEHRRSEPNNHPSTNKISYSWVEPAQPPTLFCHTPGTSGFSCCQYCHFLFASKNDTWLYSPASMSTQNLLELCILIHRQILL